MCHGSASTSVPFGLCSHHVDTRNGEEPAIVDEGCKKLLSVQKLVELVYHLQWTKKP